MTVGQSWDKQVPFLTDIHISKTKTKPCVPFCPSIPRSQLGTGATGHMWVCPGRAPGYQDPSQPGPKASQGLEPWPGLLLPTGELGQASDPQGIRLLFGAGSVGPW